MTEIDIDDRVLCLQHFAQAVRERGTLDVHLIAEAMRPIGRMVELPICSICEQAAFVTVWPVAAPPVETREALAQEELPRLLRLWADYKENKVMVTQADVDKWGPKLLRAAADALTAYETQRASAWTERRDLLGTLAVTKAALDTVNGEIADRAVGRGVETTPPTEERIEAIRQELWRSLDCEQSDVFLRLTAERIAALEGVGTTQEVASLIARCEDHANWLLAGTARADVLKLAARARRDMRTRWWVDSRNTNYYLCANDGTIAGPFEKSQEYFLSQIADAHNKAQEPEAAPPVETREALAQRLNGWNEIGQEMLRILACMSEQQRDDLLPDWFAPRLVAFVNAAAPARTVGTPPQEPTP